MKTPLSCCLATFPHFMRQKFLCFSALSVFLICGNAANSSAETWRSSLYPENWQPGFADAQGHFLHDFSYAGYHRGEKPLPDRTGNVIDVTKPPYGADKTGVNDSSIAIQAALDKADADGGGVAFMPAGTYRVSPKGEANFALQLSGDNVVLRGEGTDKTFLYNDSLEMRKKNVILVTPKIPINWSTENMITAKVTEDLLKPARAIPVEDTSAFKVGGLIFIRSDITQRFIDELGMNGIWTAGAPYPCGIIYCRRVTAVNAANKTISVDTPLRGFLRLDDNLRIKIPKAGRMLTESGLENFSIGMKQHPGGRVDVDFEKNLPEGTAGYAMHWATAVKFEATENCWIRHVNSYRPEGNAPDIHIQSHGIRLFACRQLTVESCQWGFPQYRGEGGNGYMFTLYSCNDCLIKNCEGESGRHNFSFGEMASNGNVILNFHCKDGRLPSDFHMFFSLANLVDNAICEGDLVQSIPRNNVKHGVTTTQSVFWNTEGRRYQNDFIYRDIPNKGSQFIVQSKQWGDGYVIGTRGPASAVETTNFSEGIGKGDSLAPKSLYEDQLQRRLAHEAASTPPAKRDGLVPELGR